MKKLVILIALLLSFLSANKTIPIIVYETSDKVIVSGLVEKIEDNKVYVYSYKGDIMPLNIITINHSNKNQTFHSLYSYHRGYKLDYHNCVMYYNPNFDKMVVFHNRFVIEVAIIY